jgi:16S rRNA (uracil1498-N3)-methyltransferase
LDGDFFVAHCREDAEKIGLIEAVEKKQTRQSISILIGPEGDFSSAEIQRFYQHNVSSISLGNNRLRTETAGLYCAMVLNACL